MCSQHLPKDRFVPLIRFHNSWWAIALIIACGVLFIGFGAWLEVPMRPVPMSMQTYAVVVVGALAGWRLGAAVVLAYLVVSAAGAPLLAGGESGIDALLGNTAGYLLGFIFSAAFVGFLAEGSWTNRGLLRSSLAMLMGHCITLVLGAAWLATRIGFLPAVEHGVLPFLAGAVAKSILASATVEVVRRIGAVHRP